MKTATATTCVTMTMKSELAEETFTYDYHAACVPATLAANETIAPAKAKSISDHCVYCNRFLSPLVRQPRSTFTRIMAVRRTVKVRSQFMWDGFDAQGRIRMMAFIREMHDAYTKDGYDLYN